MVVNISYHMIGLQLEVINRPGGGGDGEKPKDFGSGILEEG